MSKGLVIVPGDSAYSTFELKLGLLQTGIRPPYLVMANKSGSPPSPRSAENTHPKYPLKEIGPWWAATGQENSKKSTNYGFSGRLWVKTRKTVPEPIL